MKKIYIAPSEKIVKISTCSMLAESGVANGCSLGNEYNDQDVSYTKESSSSNVWDNEW